MTGPCNWLVKRPADCPAIECLGEDEQAWVEQMAVDFLWRWTGQSLGACEITVRPCREDCGDFLSTFYGSGPTTTGPNGWMWRPVIIDGLWYNMGCGRCRDRCSCAHVSQIRMPGPIVSIISIEIDGDLLPSGSYRVDNRNLLVREDGAEWPRCNDLSKPAGEPGTWTVTYLRGAEVPIGGQLAAGVLAEELAKVLCNDASCKLPQRFQSITRQGVTVAMLDSFDDIDKGHTGIWLIDSWLASVTQPPQRSRVYSPDVSPPRRTTFPVP